MKRIKRTLITEDAEPKYSREKLPIRWWVDKVETEVSNDGVTVVLNYHPDVGTDKQIRKRFYDFSDAELETVRLKGDESNPFNKVGMIRALVHEAQDKFKKEVSRQIFDRYHDKGLDETLELFETDNNIDYLLRGFALYEAKLLRINASAH